jgi:hypothetical protein
MLRWLKVALLATALSISLVPGGGAQTLDESRPMAAVPLDFLGWIGQNEDWLRAELTGQGLASGFEITQGRLESENVDVLRAVNRIRAFAHLAARGLRLPYLDLPLAAADGSKIRCVTLFPRSIVPSISAADYKKPEFPAAGAEPTILDLCRVDGAKLAEYAGMDRRALRERFFDRNGDLKSEFADLNSNPALVAAVVDKGFYAYQGDVTGRTRVEP